MMNKSLILVAGAVCVVIGLIVADDFSNAKRAEIALAQSRAEVLAKQARNLDASSAAQKKLTDSINNLAVTFERFTSVVAKMEQVSEKNTLIVESAEKNQARAEAILGKQEAHVLRQTEFLLQVKVSQETLTQNLRAMKDQLDASEKRARDMDAQRIMPPRLTIH